MFRVAAYPDKGEPLVIKARFFSEAQYILDQFHAGKYDDPKKYKAVYIERICILHGWQAVHPGTDICGECLDDYHYPDR